jgi:hypothetical protein
MNLGQRIVLQAGGPGSGRHAGGGFAIVTHRTGAIVKGIPTKEAAKVLMNQKKAAASAAYKSRSGHHYSAPPEKMKVVEHGPDESLSDIGSRVQQESGKVLSYF